MAEYIERTQAIDAIEAHMHRQDPDDRGVYPLEDWQREQNYAYDLAMEILGNLPAADVKPVVHGKWIIERSNSGKPICYCSSCGCGVKDKDSDTYIDMSDAPFCPHCGADMREPETKKEPAPAPYDLLHEEGGWNLQ